MIQDFINLEFQTSFWFEAMKSGIKVNITQVRCLCNDFN